MPEETPQLPISEQEIQIEAPSFLDKLKLQKKKILIGLGVFLGVLVLGGAVFGIYKYAQNQISPGEPTPTPLPPEVSTEEGDPTADWETYTNAKYGYSIKYPKDWYTTEPEGGPEKGRRIDFHPWRERSFDKVDYQISIIVNDVGYEKSLTAWLDEKIGSYPEEIKSLITREKVTLDNFEGEKVLEELSQAGVYNIYTKKNSFVYNFMLAPYSPKELSELLPESLDYFNFILSTFKFLEEETPSPTPSTKIINYQVINGWTRYDNVSGSYSIQYDPTKYKIVDEDVTNPTYSIIDELTLSCLTPNCQTGTWIRIYSNYDGSSLRNWLEEFRNISRTDRYFEDVIVENVKTLVAMDDRITEVAIPSNDKVISVEMKGPFYNVTQKKPINIEFIYQFLSTFKFIE